MAKFIKLTDLKRGNMFALNIEMIEYILPIPNSNGTALVSVTHHTKYEVQESMDDIFATLEEPIVMLDGPIAVD
jgi:uncharacterized protein YlzI (FlbEa/FlbD family)